MINLLPPCRFSPLPNVLALAALSFGLATACQAQSGNTNATQVGYKYTTVDDPNSTGTAASTFVTGINDAGVIVGYYSVSSPSTPSYIGFSHSGTNYSKNYTDISASKANNPITMAFGVNNGGTVVGDYNTGPSVYSGFTDTNGSLTPVNASTNSPANIVGGINTAGNLVGYYVDSNNTNIYHGFLGVGTNYTTITDPSATNSVNPGFTEARGINDTGQIVGFYQASDGSYQGFLDSSSTSTFTTLSLTGAADTYLLGINNLGQAVGFYQNATGTHGFLDAYTAAGGFSPNFLTFNDPNANDGTYVSGINNAGDVVGYYSVLSNGVVTTNGFYAAAPEPAQSAALAFVCFGLGGLLLRARKRAV